MNWYDNFVKDFVIDVPLKRIGDQISHQEFNSLLSILIGNGTKGIMTNTLCVTGKTYIGGLLNARANISTPTLHATTSVNTKSLNVTEKFINDGLATFNKKTNFNHDVFFATTKTATFNGSVIVNGISEIKNNISFIAGKKATFNGQIEANGNVNISGVANLKNNVQIGETYENTLIIKSKTTFQSNINASNVNITLKNATISENLNVAGDTNLKNLETLYLTANDTTVETLSATTVTVDNSITSKALSVTTKTTTNSLDVTTKTTTNELDVTTKTTTNSLDVTTKTTTNELDVTTKTTTNSLDVTTKTTTNELDVTTKTTTNELLVNGGAKITENLEVSGELQGNAKTQIIDYVDESTSTLRNDVNASLETINSNIETITNRISTNETNNSTNATNITSVTSNANHLRTFLGGTEEVSITMNTGYADYIDSNTDLVEKTYTTLQDLITDLNTELQTLADKLKA